MTPEEKQLLLIDLCARLPYSPFVQLMEKFDDEDSEHFREIHNLSTYDIELFNSGEISNIKPYLRPMSSMTEEEIKEHNKQICKDDEYLRKTFEIPYACTVGLYELDWLNTHHFDYRDLIGQGLALPAPEDMYEKKINT